MHGTCRRRIGCSTPLPLLCFLRIRHKNSGLPSSIGSSNLINFTWLLCIRRRSSVCFHLFVYLSSCVQEVDSVNQLVLPVSCASGWHCLLRCSCVSCQVYAAHSPLLFAVDLVGRHDKLGSSRPEEGPDYLHVESTMARYQKTYLFILPFVSCNLVCPYYDYQLCLVVVMQETTCALCLLAQCFWLYVISSA